MEPRSAEQWATRLFEARRDRQPIQPISEQVPDLTVTDAYEIQQHFVRLLREEGEAVVGHKLGLTSAPMQEMLGVDEPDYAAVLSGSVDDHGAEIEVASFLAPRVEAEIALILNEPLRGPGVTTEQAGRAVGAAVAALEIVDSRIADWRIALVDTVADLASCGRVVLGARAVPLDGWDPRLVGMVITRNGHIEATGAGAAALGDPLRAVAWLANTLARFDTTLEAGQFVMTGSLHKAFAPNPGDRIRADFDRLGSVNCHFV